MGDCADEAQSLKKSLEILTSTFDECIEYIQEQLKDRKDLLNHLNKMMKEIRLYNIEEPFVLLSSNYGVPQNRERVVFVGCRNDQEVIKEIPATVTDSEKVKVYEALWDLNMIGNGETVTSYKKPKLNPKYESTKIQRAIQGEPDERGLLFSEWSKTGRLGHRFTFNEEPFYVLNMSELEKPKNISTWNYSTTRRAYKMRKFVNACELLQSMEIMMMQKQNLKRKGWSLRSVTMSF